ncbi:MAG: response regulator transcription factor [Nitrospinales bacterium]
MKSKLLIVDDSATILKIVTMAFEKEDIEVQGAAGGKEAWEKMPDFQPDIVVADTNMPGMSGFDLSKKIKGSDKFKSVLVLLLTSDFEGLDEKLFKESRADDHIAKPFKSESIVSKVKGLLERGSEQAAEEPAAIELSMEDAADEPTPIKLSTDDMVETPEPVELPMEDAAQDAPKIEMESPAEESFDDMVGDIIQESVLPEELPDETAASEPAEQAESSGPVEEMSVEEMLASAEEMFLAEEDENESGEEEEAVPGEAEEPAGDSAPSAAEDEVSEQESAEILELLEEEEQAASSPDAVEAEEPEPTPAVQAADEAPEPEEEASEKKKAAPAPAAGDMSIEELLSSAEELLKDNYLEKASAVAAEKESDLPQGAQPAEMQLEAREQAAPSGSEDSSEEEDLADVDASDLDSEDELDSVFNSIQSFEVGAEPEDSLPPGAVAPAQGTGVSHVSAEPESGDLAEKMAPAAVTSGGIEGKPDLIRETLSYLSDLSSDRAEAGQSRAAQSHADQQRGISMNKETTGDMFSEVVGEHIQQILERSLKDAIAKEISGLSRTIERSVRESVKEVTPGIARAIIQEEIEKIRKMEEA